MFSGGSVVGKDRLVRELRLIAPRTNRKLLTAHELLHENPPTGGAI